VKPVIDRVSSLDDLPATIRDLAEGRTRGKAVVAILFDTDSNHTTGRDQLSTHIGKAEATTEPSLHLHRSAPSSSVCSSSRRH